MFKKMNMMKDSSIIIYWEKKKEVITQNREEV